MMTAFEELLTKDGLLVYKTRGTSMKPMLRADKDLVIIRAPDFRLKPYDVAFYRRGNGYHLHRVIGVGADHYLIRGDNTYSIETVPDNDVIGVLSAFRRGNTHYNVTDRGYRCYARFWTVIYPLRHFFCWVKRHLRMAWKSQRDL